ncbi:N-acetylmuramoyl-L-alanine amidase family protein [Aneurinibacillus migulanus]|uniref:N-acetylmuramoyl-L-alanine amidase family protein n=1 Tax=Aneurinibacillus migulanus TaxID=47500 RepID=UPI00209C72F8|nr:N-acetylmuramoyl-L-alanine amidase [Aneurinibacillus migulanus]MCP1357493.1 N-acetylmuramoyl-L-alanine amidase [Aneurinibacillus migulanus]
MSKVVVIDPGHGLPDPGACGNGLQEHERAFYLAQLVQNVLTRHGVTVFLTRNGERSLSSATSLRANKNEDLAARQRFSNSKATDFFLSLHMNASSESTANGYETLCYSQNRQIEALHTAVKEFLQQYGLKDRGIKIRTNLAVLKVKAKAALLECFFITNPKEAALMKDGAFLLDLAEAIGKGVLAAIGIAYVPIKKPAAPQPIQPKGAQQLMKAEDANKVIRILQDRWNAATCQDERKEIGRLADEVRVAAGMKKVNS